MEKCWEVAGVEQGLVTEEGGEEAPTTGMDCAIGSNDFMEITVDEGNVIGNEPSSDEVHRGVDFLSKGKFHESPAGDEDTSS